MISQTDRAVIWQLAKKDLLDRYAGSVLGGLWSFIQPLLNMLVFILVFSQIMQARLPEAVGEHSYSIYLISGLLGWIAFASTLMRSTTMFLDQSGIITKVRVSLYVFPFAVVLSDALIYVISFGLFLGFLHVAKHPWSLAYLWIAPVFALQQAFAVSLGLVLGTLSIFLRDIREAVGVFLQLWFWLTPIVYVASILPTSVERALGINPMSAVVATYHDIILLGQGPAPFALLPLLVGTLGLALLGRWLLRRLESDIRDLI